MLLLRRIAYLAPLLAILLSVGCAVPQPRGEGLYQYIKEPTTGAGYHLYLPGDYVKNNGRYPNDKLKRWPLVMTFHGMKPYDNALPQEREWEKQADIYGFIVCAPELNTSDSFMEYPLTKEHSYVLEDRKNVLAIMDHIAATTLADPKRVLATSWSCGGYLAHYFPNRFPERFTCIATRLSNFSQQLMVDETVPRYKDRVPVAVFIGDGDFAKCRSESEVAVAWYQARGFRVRGRMIDNMGHSRIPQTAAAFFAESLGIDPLHPKEAAATVALVQMTEYNPPPALIAQVSPMGSRTALALAQPQYTPPPRPVTPATPPPTQLPQKQTAGYTNTTAGRDYPSNARPSYDPTPNRGANPSAGQTQLAAADSRGNRAAPPRDIQPPKSVSTPQRESTMPPVRSSVPSQKPVSTKKPVQVVDASNARRPASPPPQRSRRSDAGDSSAGGASAAGAVRASGDSRVASATRKPSTDSSAAPRRSGRVRRVNIKLSGPVIGTSPHYLAYSVDLPREEIDGADFLWMDNGVWIGDEPRGVKILETPGVHRISVLVVTHDNLEYRGSSTVQVLDRGPTAAAN